MRREARLAAALAILGVLVCLAGPAAAQRPAADCEQTQDEPADSKGDARSALPAWVAELTEIRRQVGGGPLAGSLLDASSHEDAHADDAFAAELGRLAAEPPSPPSATNELLPDGVRPAVLTAPSSLDEELIAALRRAATLLDAKANESERPQSYARADRCRRLAQQLRRQARELDAASP